MKINILAFGIAKEICGARAFELEVSEPCDTEALKVLLYQKFPALHTLASCQIAVNEEYAHTPKLLSTGDEIAILPPVSGG